MMPVQQLEKTFSVSRNVQWLSKYADIVDGAINLDDLAGLSDGQEADLIALSTFLNGADEGVFACARLNIREIIKSGVSPLDALLQYAKERKEDRPTEEFQTVLEEVQTALAAVQNA